MYLVWMGISRHRLKSFKAPRKSVAIQSNFDAARQVTGPARVVDGDTIWIGQTKIRLHGIDAPERRFISRSPKADYGNSLAGNRRLWEMCYPHYSSCENRQLNQINQTLPKRGLACQCPCFT